MNHNHQPIEERFAELFASLDINAPEVDPSVRDRLEKESLQAFAKHFSSKRQSQKTQLPKRNRRMYLLAMRSLVATAVAALVAFGLFSSNSESDAPTLAAVFENVAAADSLHFEITTDGKSEQIWVSKPGRMRWDTAEGKYRIAQDGRMWDIDEKANRATTLNKSYFDGKKQFDVLALLGLHRGEKERSLLDTKPTETVTRKGRELSVYRANLTADEGPIRVEARVDVGTCQLRSFRIEPVGKTARPAIALNILAANEPIDEDKFVVGDTLTEDGRIGKITDTQGIVTLKPVMHSRWTPVAKQLLVKPGDWLRTDTRGANAVNVRLADQTEITLGPGSLVELILPGKIRLIHGEIKIVADAKHPITLLTPNDQTHSIKGTRLLRLDEERLVRVEKDPLWLQGFEGATSNQSIGSLVAKIDGRNVPLTVGYHKVSVDIRDQIARTVIEESFVNHTNSRLEGIFYFPLPQDASISGFGMWIGNELVEADVVEKQRAREIYETILRENRDPGLLEWTGGNLFKARVFPIFGNSEKRIKITYTQVLPLRGDRFRYSYGLQSEMLKQHPLRELTLDVKIHSAIPITKVSSPTHTARIARTGNSAHVEFAAQEYTPKRDFEVVVQLDRSQSDVVLIPHRRGDDGYFMLQLTPPNDAKKVVAKKVSGTFSAKHPSGRDAKKVVAKKVSAAKKVSGTFSAKHPSGRSGKRFLTPFLRPPFLQRDILPDSGPLRLLILADTSASLDRSQRTTQAEFIASLLASLGSDDTFNLAGCDVGCDWAFKRPQAATDENVKIARRLLEGRVSLGWTDLDKAFGEALEQCDAKTRVIYVGDGIVTTGDCDPVAFAGRLRRMCEGRAVGFHSVAVGSTFEPVVMKTIASLGGGTVRRISGEKTPQAVALELLGEIAKPAIRDLKVEFRGLSTARVYPSELPNLPGGTQQILLGRYLPQGKDRDQQGEVIVTGTRDGQPVRFSSPVSLVDAERGNSFIPRLWARMHLDVLLEQGTSQSIQDDIIALSEEYHIITPYTSLLVLESDADRERFKVKRRFQIRDGEKFFAEGRDAANFELTQQQMRRAGNWRIGLRRRVLSQLMGLGRNPQILQSDPGMGFAGMGGGGSWQTDNLNGTQWGQYGGADFSEREDPRDWEAFDYDSDISLATDNPDDPVPGIPVDTPQPIVALEPLREPMPMSFRLGEEEGERKSKPFYKIGGESVATNSGYGWVEKGQSFRTESNYSTFDDIYNRKSSGASESSYPNWFYRLFPDLSPSPIEPVKPDSDKRWPADARALAQSLLRTETLAKLGGGLEVEERDESFDVRYERLSSQSNRLSLVSPTAWLVRNQTVGLNPLVEWCDKRHRAVFSKAYQLGRRRVSTDLDLSRPPVELGDYTTHSIEQEYQTYQPEIKPLGENRTLFVLKHPTAENYEMRLLIDTARQIVLRQETERNGQIISTCVASDFVEVAGAWWATRWETFDAEEKLIRRTTRRIKSLATDRFQQKLDAQLAGLDRVQMIQDPPVSVDDAKQSAAEGKDTFDDQLVLMLHFSQTQQWDRVIEHLEAAKTRADDKPGVRWIDSAVLCDRRRFEEARQHYTQEAERLAQRKSTEDFYLAEYLRGQAGHFQANEMIALLDMLLPVYHRQPEHLEAMKRWMRDKSNRLRQTGRPDEAIAMQKALAEQYPFDSSLQTNYAQQLITQGDYPAAYAWLDRAIANKAAKWLPHELDSMRNYYSSSLRNQGRYDVLVEYLSKWVATNPKNSSVYQQYLTALVRTDQLDKVDALVAAWIEVAQSPERIDSVDGAKLSTAVSLMLGQGYNLNTNRIEPRWIEPLADIVLLLDVHPSHGHVSDQIMQHGQFRQTDACRRVRKKALARLLDRIETLKPGHAQRYIRWIMANDPAIEARQWRKIATVMKTRWLAEKDPNVKHSIGQILDTVYRRIDIESQLDFLRQQLEEGPNEIQFRSIYAQQLFHLLNSLPWTAEIENGAFGLIDKLTPTKDKTEQILSQLRAVHQLTDQMSDARSRAAMAKVNNQEDMTRTELSEKKQANLKAARRGFADRLAKEARTRDAVLAGWITVERLYLDILTEHDLDQAAEECWEVVGAKPQPLSEEPVGLDRLEPLRRERCLEMLLHLSVRSGAKPELADRMLGYIDAGIEADADNAGWKMLKYRILVALDRPAEIEKHLRYCIRTDTHPTGWQVSLGYLLAEQAKIKEAIKLFEAVREADELRPAEHRALADWYMVVDRREDHERALIAVYKTMDEWRISNAISQKLQPWQNSRGELPGELDKNVLRMFAAVFQKSNNPSNHLGYLNFFYRATHDFRLLESVSEGVIGHTAGGVYPYLKQMRSVLEEVRDEATADSIVEHIEKVRGRENTTIDLRALDLLELLVERRGAELINQPGPHIQKALAAMQRAFKREWSEGEPRLMADFLANLRTLSAKELADEQLRELNVLHNTAENGSIDRLMIAHALAQTWYGYQRTDEATDLLDAAINEYVAAVGGTLPTQANTPFDTLISYLQSARHHRRAEDTITKQLEHPANQRQRFWLTLRLNRTYHNALMNKGTVSLGSGRELYENLEARILEEMKTDDQNHRYQCVNLLCDVYRAAHNQAALSGVPDDVRTFAFERFPQLLPGQIGHYQNMVNHVAQTLHDMAGPRDGLKFLIERIETEPKWLRYNNQDGWSSYGGNLAHWRHETKDLGDLEPRLLKIVLAELRKELTSRQSRNRSIYHNDYGHFWREKANDFAITAEEVYTEYKRSIAAVKYIAQYVYHGLDRVDRAIEMLSIAHDEKILDESGQVQLVQYLRGQNRDGESIALLKTMVEKWPDNIQYRIWLMHAFYKTRQQAGLLALLEQTDAYFHEKGRWGEHIIATLGSSCLENELFEQSAAYYEELIPLHQRSQPNRGIGNGTLSQYYSFMARAYSGLKNTAKAVDAACGAVVSWGPGHANRANALNALTQVLRNSPDLDAYVAVLDKQCKETGLENPIVRKALGIVYLEKKQYDKATAQLTLAVNVQPNDTETHRKLIECFDKQSDKQGAIDQLFDSLQLSRRDINLYQDLGRRLEELERPEDAERANASIVEVLPSESESHTMLAEIRQRQNRWPEAIVHWRQVVRIRALEPTGLIKLAEAQIHQKQWDDATETLEKLNKGWPPRFGDVPDTIRNLRTRIDQERAKE